MYTSKASIYKVHIRHLHIVAITVLNELSWIKSTETKKSEFSELGCLFSLCCMSTEIHVSDLAIFHLSKYLPSTPLSHIPQVLAHQSPSPLLLRNFAGCACPECWVLLPLRAKSLVLWGSILVSFFLHGLSISSQALSLFSANLYPVLSARPLFCSVPL